MLKRMKGTYDVIEDIAYLQEIERCIAIVSKLYNYQEIRTPHFEASELFHRSVGETTDIISKETYDFKDRGNRSNTLRPEGTAGIVRAYIENKLYANPIVPQKVYYLGSMFRYERPQKGRFREFRQFGAEAFGSHHPSLDAEIIAYAITVLKALKVGETTVYLNSLGDQESKANYKERLIKYFKHELTTLCDDCKRRYQENPLRILDCKVDQDKPVVKDAPKPLDHLTPQDQEHFEQVIAALEAMNIAYEIDKSLVRGLDYYTHTVFEIKVSEALLGRQNAICGGGRYNHLVEHLGGPKTPAVGFAFGIERLMLALKEAKVFEPKKHLHAYIQIIGATPRLYALNLLQSLREKGLKTDIDYLEKALKGQFKQAEHQHARFIIIVGEEELKDQTVNVKDQTTEQSYTFKQDELADKLIAILKLTHKGA